MIRYFFLLFIALAFFSCKNQTQQEKPVARVYDKYLFRSDLEDIFPAGISASDSALMANDYIDKWIRKELLVNKAELNLTEEEKNVEKQIENYKSSLLIFKYEQNLIKQKIDTVITEKEIEDYYNSNLSNFLLNHNIVKALFLQVPLNSPEIQNVKKWYRSDSDEDVKKLDAYAFQYAKKYDYFNEDWTDFRQIENALPVKLNNPDNYLRYRKNLELSDSTYYYFVNLKEYRLNGEVAPLEYVKENIRTIVMNKRKVQLIKKLEANVYNDALNKGFFTIY